MKSWCPSLQGPEWDLDSKSSSAQSPGNRERSIVPLNHRRQALTTADAHRLQSITGVAALHLIQQRGHHAGAGRSHWVAQADTGSIDVQVAEVRHTQILQDGQRLDGERLVELDEVHVLEAEPGFAKRLTDSGHRTDAHDV